MAGYLACFVFDVGVHEKHLFVAALLALMLCARQRQWLWPTTALCSLQTLNLVLFNGWSGRQPAFDRTIFDSTSPSSPPFSSSPSTGGCSGS
jgi:hypothetical protein